MQTVQQYKQPLEKVKTAKDALNGDKKLEDAKQVAKDAIDNLKQLK